MENLMAIGMSWDRIKFKSLFGGIGKGLHPMFRNNSVENRIFSKPQVSSQRGLWAWTCASIRIVPAPSLGETSLWRMPLREKILFPGFQGISRICAEGLASCNVHQCCSNNSLDHASFRKHKFLHTRNFHYICLESSVRTTYIRVGDKFGRNAISTNIVFADDKIEFQYMRGSLVYNGDVLTLPGKCVEHAPLKEPQLSQSRCILACLGLSDQNRPDASHCAYTLEGLQHSPPRKIAWWKAL